MFDQRVVSTALGIGRRIGRIVADHNFRQSRLQSSSDIPGKANAAVLDVVYPEHDRRSESRSAQPRDEMGEQLVLNFIEEYSLVSLVKGRQGAGRNPHRRTREDARTADRLSAHGYRGFQGKRD